MENADLCYVKDDSRIVFDYEFAYSLGFVEPLSLIFEDIGAKEVIIIILLLLWCQDWLLISRHILWHVTNPLCGVRVTAVIFVNIELLHKQ